MAKNITTNPTITYFNNTFIRFDIPFLSRVKPKPIYIKKQEKSIILLYLVA